MKKILFYYLALCLCLSSCETDPLDITPDGRITVELIFKDEDKTESFLNTVYGFIPTYFMSYNLNSLLASITDEAQSSDVGNEVNGGVAGLWMVGSLTPSSDPTGVNHYSVFWQGIRNANIFLENIDNANIPVVSKKERLKAEAKLLRAFYYWELVKKYGAMPIVDKSFKNDFDYTSLTRPAFQDNIDFIVKECNEVIANPNFPLRLIVEQERGRFTKAIAYAIKSQALLYNASQLWNPTNNVAKWSAASTAAKEALAVLTANSNYTLAPDYESYFRTKMDISDAPKDRETIFERPGSLSIGVLQLNSIPSVPGMARAGDCPSQEMVDSYDMKSTGEPAILGYQDEDHLQPIINAASGYDENNPYVGRDPRFYNTVWYNGAQYDNIAGKIHTIETFLGGKDQLIKNPPSRRNTHTGFYLRKFMESRLRLDAGGAGLDAGWKKYRLAELYLNYAEAENEASGPNNDVYEAINKIRSRSAMPDLPSGLNQDQMRERIRRERRVELAMEEHRFWDVRRWKILDKTDKLVTGIEITKNPNSTFTYKRFVTERRNSWQEKFLIFPIPIGDSSIIPYFANNNNPGW